MFTDACAGERPEEITSGRIGEVGADPARLRSRLACERRQGISAHPFCVDCNRPDPPIHWPGARPQKLCVGAARATASRKSLFLSYFFSAAVNAADL